MTRTDRIFSFVVVVEAMSLSKFCGLARSCPSLKRVPAASALSFDRRMHLGRGRMEAKAAAGGGVSREYPVVDHK